MRNIITHKLERTDIEVKKHIKSFAALCSMAMVFSIFSCAVFADGPATIDQGFIDRNGGKLPETRGTYTLSEDIAVSDTAQIAEDLANIAIDLNGHTITYSGSGSMYIVGKTTQTEVVADNVVLTISNGSITTAAGYTGGGSTDYWISSTMCTTPDDGRGGCFLLQYGSTLNLNAVAISNFKSVDEGGAIHVGNGSKLYMNGGSITGCSSANGGAVSVHCSSKGRTSVIDGVTYNICGKAEISGATISGNTASAMGGGIKVLRGDLVLADCVITDNTCKGSGANGGGGVGISNSTNNAENIAIKGNVQIHGNHSTHGADRADLFFSNVKTIHLADDLDAASQIYFGCQTWSKNDQYFKIDGHSYDLSSFISANSANPVTYNSSNDAIMAIIAPKITGYSVSLDGRILFAPEIDLQSYADANTSVTYSYEYTKTGKAATTVSGTVAFSELKKKGNNYTLQIPVKPSCLTAPIQITVNYGTNGDSISDTRTVEQYAQSIAKGNNVKNKEIAEALLIYGGYAQVQLKINTSKLPKVSGVDFNSSFDDNIQGTAYTVTNDPNNAYYGASVSFLSEVSVKMYFKKSVLGDTAPDMTVAYASGGSETITGKANGGYYEYVISGPSGTGFAATQYDASFDFSIGSDISGSYSVDTYLKAIKNSSTSSEAMKNLAEAYYNFALKCLA